MAPAEAPAEAAPPPAAPPARHHHRHRHHPLGGAAPPRALAALRPLPAPARELAAGGVAGAAAKTLVAPLERAKILFQTGRLSEGGVRGTLAGIARAEGAAGLFRGNGASVLRIVPYASVHFGLYEAYRRRLVAARAPRAPGARAPPWLDLVAGAASGASAVAATYPLDLVRTRLAFATEAGAAAAGGPAPAGAAAAAAAPRATIRSVLRDVRAREGAAGLYRGVGPSLWGILPYAGLKFYVYQALKHAYADAGFLGEGEGEGAPGGGAGGAAPDLAVDAPRRAPVPVLLAFGAAAGLVAQSVTYPLDVVRRRMQVEGLLDGGAAGGGAAGGGARGPPGGAALPRGAFPPGRLPRSTPRALAAIAARHGWRPLYAGLSINYMKVVPSTAIGFTIYDYMKWALDLPTHL